MATYSHHLAASEIPPPLHRHALLEGGVAAARRRQALVPPVARTELPVVLDMGQVAEGAWVGTKVLQSRSRCGARACSRDTTVRCVPRGAGAR